MSRRNGFANEEFRKEYKKDKTLKVSKGYDEIRLAYAKLEREICRKRNDYYNNITSEIIGSNSFIGIETLNVTGMFRNRHLSYALSDAAMGTILEMIKYKADWYGRECVAIGRWTPSSKKCNQCGYIYKELKLSERAWKCPICGTNHDRDINASINIYNYAKEKIT